MVSRAIQQGDYSPGHVQSAVAALSSAALVAEDAPECATHKGVLLPRSCLPLRGTTCPSRFSLIQCDAHVPVLLQG